jgi:hypothetical protein
MEGGSRKEEKKNGREGRGAQRCRLNSSSLLKYLHSQQLHDEAMSPTRSRADGATVRRYYGSDVEILNHPPTAN